MSNSTEVDIKYIQKALEKNPRYSAPLTVLARRKRSREGMTFRVMYRELRKGIIDIETRKVYVEPQQWSHEELTAFFEVLQEGKAGKIIMHPDTPEFVFNKYALQSVARAVLGMKDPTTNKPVTQIEVRKGRVSRNTYAKIPDNTTAGVSIAAAAQSVKLVREGLEIELRIDPLSLTSEAATKMSELIAWFKGNSKKGA